MLETTEAAANRTNVDALRDGLRAHGYVEGQNLAIEYRSADGRGERFANLAAELVRLNLDLIVTRGTPAAFAARNASPHISQVSRCGGWVRAGGWFRTWPARVPAAVGGWAGSTMVSLVAGLVESRSQAAAALRNRA